MQNTGKVRKLIVDVVLGTVLVDMYAYLTSRLLGTLNAAGIQRMQNTGKVRKLIAVFSQCKVVAGFEMQSPKSAS